MGYYRDLEAWKEAHQLVLAVYRLTGSFPRDERFGLTAQVRKAVVSVTSNIAEGAGRRTDPWMLAFIGYSMGSLQEVDSQLLVAKDLAFAPAVAFADCEARVGRVARLLAGLRASLERTTGRGPPRHPRQVPKPPSDPRPTTDDQ